jgi:hypothetical protein
VQRQVNSRFSAGATDFSSILSGQTGPGPPSPAPQAPVQRALGALSSGLKRPEHDIGHTSPSSANVKNEWSYTSIPPTRFRSVHYDNVASDQTDVRATAATCNMSVFCVYTARVAVFAKLKCLSTLTVLSSARPTFPPLPPSPAIPHTQTHTHTKNKTGTAKQNKTTNLLRRVWHKTEHLNTDTLLASILNYDPQTKV